MAEFILDKIIEWSLQNNKMSTGIFWKFKNIPRNLHLNYILQWCKCKKEYFECYERISEKEKYILNYL